LKSILSPQLFQLICSFLQGRRFKVVVDGAESLQRSICAGVLGPTLYTLFTADMPTARAIAGINEEDMLIATFADDTAVLTRSPCIDIASQALQRYVCCFENWANKWNISINSSKCANVTFTTRTMSCKVITMSGSTLAHKESHKYLGVILDRLLNFKDHTTMIKHSVLQKAKKMEWLLSPQNKLTLHNKVTIYKAILSPIWKYALQIYGTAAKSNLNKIRVAQAKILRKISGVPWYIRNRDIEKNLKVPMVGDVLQNLATSYAHRLCEHPNTLARQLTARPRKRRLKRCHPIDLPKRVIS